MFLQTGVEFLWLPVGAHVSFEQLHTMVDSRSGGKEEQRSTLVTEERRWGDARQHSRGVDTHMMGGLYQ